MTKEIYTDICERLKNDIIRLYKIHCWRCVRARIVRLARYTTEYNGSDYAQISIKNVCIIVNNTINFLKQCSQVVFDLPLTRVEPLK